MNTEQAYNIWAEQYDTNQNRTRDLEAVSIRELLAGRKFVRVLEIGCGTGKNTEWLQSIADEIVAVDLSEQMLAKAREKISSEKVEFLQADINEAWDFALGSYDLVTFSLVLEHIDDLQAVFTKVAACLNPGGMVYVGELHPFKQYSGTKARFDTAEGRQIVPCFNHHVSDFTGAAAAQGMQILELREYFDGGDRDGIPRILALLFRKKASE